MPEGALAPPSLSGPRGRPGERGHTLTVDSGWREVRYEALGFVKRFVQPAKPG
jgi:hypothetical protein